ncbi:unnamed protein product [Paramecium octaurelia]|uniref:Transcription factor CBF/NF-Y/archaeal histone domain-containing protein n=1 Tax=Paramecium octaurelia TaxID=43137 RepID=A0A8S1SWE0_PAROT|nr:unnamed protein product [Paramecium octaurelia]
MDEELLDNLQAEEDDNEIQNFPLFQQKQIGEFVKKILGDNINTQKAFRDKFNRCLSLFVFYMSHMVTVMKEDNRKKKHEKKKVQVTKEDIINTLKLIDFQEIAETLENLQLLQFQEKQIQQENQLEQELEVNEMREIQNFKNMNDELKVEENNDNDEQIQDNQDQLVEEIDDEDIENGQLNENEQ